MDEGYKMGVYLCLGQQIYNLKHNDSIHINKLGNFQAIHQYMEKNDKVFLFLGEGLHKIKRKAEQIACQEALIFLNLQNETIEDS